MHVNQIPDGMYFDWVLILSVMHIMTLIIQEDPGKNKCVYVSFECI